MARPKPSPTELAERAAKQLQRDKAVEAMSRPAPQATVAAPPSVVEVGVSRFDSDVVLPPPRAVQLPPKRSDGWGKPVIIEVKTVRPES
jgi:hypothetical protein